MDVIDGGLPLHSVIWPPSCTYVFVCDNYFGYVIMDLIMACTLMSTLVSACQQK